jgi:hypothetical protein
MATNTRFANFPMKVEIPGAAARWGGFLWHFLQMVIAMELGMMVYHKLLWPLLAQTPYADLTDAYPLFGYWGMVVSMVLGMFALMLFQRSPWKYCVQMTLAMVAPIAGLTVLVMCYLIPSHILYGIGDPVMFIAMAAFMLIRPHDHHHAAHEHAGHQTADQPQAETSEHCAH